MTDARSRPVARALNIAFTSSGLLALGLDRDVLTQFPNEFVEGMATPFRQRLLGDVGESAPELWAWGGPHRPPVHLVLLLYAADRSALVALQESESRRAAAHGLRTVATLDTVNLANREHFGFQDSISQPAIDGLSRPDRALTTLATGEFVLGYPNAYGLLAERPLLAPSADPLRILPPDSGGSGSVDLGRNGSYLVLRQLRQRVHLFWRYVDQASRRPDGASDPARRTWVASKMVGRWPSGAPLVLAPDQDDPSLSGQNDFAYHAADPDGLRCPIGAHVRRANPRDSLDPRPGSSRSIEVANHHRILRRGREYGPPVDPATLFEDVPDEEDRGLHFICLNANIARQFEFLQHTWLNSPKFAALHDEPDPLVAHHDGGANFSIPAVPVRLRYRNVPDFVVVRGGEYFFMPGLRALRYLSTLGS